LNGENQWVFEKKKPELEKKEPLSKSSRAAKETPNAKGWGVSRKRKVEQTYHHGEKKKNGIRSGQNDRLSGREGGGGERR